MPIWLLILTHLTSAGLGAVSTWFCLVRPIAKTTQHDQLVRRGRLSSVTWIVVFALVIVVIGVQQLLYQRAGNEADHNNKRLLVTNCQNANESRAANRELWGFILDVSTAGDNNPSPREQAFAQEFRDYINAVFAARDCSDLGKKYPLPNPPVIEPE